MESKMKKLVYYVATTVDNFIAHEDGSADGFLYEGEHTQDFLDSLSNFDSVLMGKNTYEYGFQFGMKPGEPAYAPYNLKNYIFSRSLRFESNDKVQLVASDELDFIRQLKQSGPEPGHEPGKDIWLCGGGAFAGYLLEQELIDELILKVHPVIFGRGIPLFGSSAKSVRLAPYASRSFNTGVTVNSYRILY
jgi:dihydrofolate reductase